MVLLWELYLLITFVYFHLNSVDFASYFTLPCSMHVCLWTVFYLWNICLLDRVWKLFFSGILKVRYTVAFTLTIKTINVVDNWSCFLIVCLQTFSHGRGKTGLTFSNKITCKGLPNSFKRSLQYGRCGLPNSLNSIEYLASEIFGLSASLNSPTSHKHTSHKSP